MLLHSLIAPLVLAAAQPSSPVADSYGWVNLFDGKTLDGWSEKGGPYDGDADWTIEDGVIVGREAEGARGGLLYTDELFGDFEFECDVKINAPFDSGIFVRMLPKKRGAQFTLDDRPGGELFGIYSNGYLFHQSGGDAAWRSGEWCHTRVRCVGHPMHLMGWIDGKLVVDYQVPAGMDEAFTPEGRIGIQVHGGMNDPEDAAVRFKNLRARRLPAAAGDVFTTDSNGLMGLTAAGEARGWQPLFNGVNLDGWLPAGAQGPLTAEEFEAAGYRAKGGVLEALHHGTAGVIRTERTNFRNFALRMDFQLTKLANSGVYLRSVDDGTNPSFNGAEVQILDDFNWEAASGSKLAPYQFTGGLYGSVAPAKSALRPIGEWNTYLITCVGTRMNCALNGTLLWDVDTATLEPKSGPAFADRAMAGFIGMQRHGSAAESENEVGASFRNIFIRELPEMGPSAR
ncbi:MAG: hypothetical protein ACJA2W_001262 [Planctomycetota bacterium]|jgi:hypothetical protein